MSNKTTSVTEQTIKHFTRLGREIKITPKAHVSVNTAGYKKEFFVETVEVTIGIGKNHAAYLIMSVEDWKALKKGEAVHVTTTKEFKELYG